MENRRLKLKDGREADVRHAYSLPPDEEVAGVGPVDPEIGMLRLDTLDGQTLAVVYNFGCHPIQGVPGRGNTADITGFASQVIEDNLGDGTVALFLQGLRRRHQPGVVQGRGPSARRRAARETCWDSARCMRAAQTDADRTIGWRCQPRRLELPRADLAQRIAALEAEQTRLVAVAAGHEPQLEDVPAADRQVQPVRRVPVRLLAPVPARDECWNEMPWANSMPRTATT